MPDKDQHKVKNTLFDLDGGKVIRTMQQELEKVLEDVTGKFDVKATGSVTLTLTVGRSREDMVTVTPKIKSTFPANTLRTGLYYHGENGTMHKRPPNQGDIEDVIQLSETKDK